jgi:hypothetical protein
MNQVKSEFEKRPSSKLTNFIHEEPQEEEEDTEFTNAK